MTVIGSAVVLVNPAVSEILAPIPLTPGSVIPAKVALVQAKVLVAVPVAV